MGAKDMLKTILDMEADGTLAAILVPYIRKPGESEESFKMQIAWQTMIKGQLLSDIRRALLPDSAKILPTQSTPQS